MSTNPSHEAGPGPRIAPITPAEETDKVHDYYALMEGPGGRKGGSKLNLVLTLARNPDLAVAYHPFGMHVLRFSTLTPRVREIATLRTAWRCKSDYEWTKHAITAARVGMTAAEIEATKSETVSPIWSPGDAWLLRAADQLCQGYDIDDQVWAGLAAQFNEAQLLDLTFTIGSYAMLAMVLNAARIQMEPG